jgi:putative acetyltransferase
MYVHPEARRQGIGAALIDQVVSTAKSENRAAMELWSDKRFVDAHRLYQRFGAKVVGQRICHDPDQSPEWGLMIDLT